ncbi:fungal hydrophobin domain-containing protein [Trichoderma velutinum]
MKCLAVTTVFVTAALAAPGLFYPPPSIIVVPGHGGGSTPILPGNGNTPIPPVNGNIPVLPGNGNFPNQPGNGNTPNQPSNGNTPNQPVNGNTPNQPASGITPNQPANGSGGAAHLCPSTLYSSAECCATDVLGLADLDCVVPSTAPANADGFQSVCAATGRRPRCCVLPLAGVGVLCQTPIGTE